MHHLSTVFLNGSSQTNNVGVRKGFDNHVCIFGVPSHQSQAIDISRALWTRGGGMFKVRLFSDLLQGRRGTLWVTAVLIWWFPGFLQFCHPQAVKSAIAQRWVELLQSGSKLWHDCFKMPAWASFCCWRPASFCPRGPYFTPLFCAPALHVLSSASLKVKHDISTAS